MCKVRKHPLLLSSVVSAGLLFAGAGMAQQQDQDRQQQQTQTDSSQYTSSDLKEKVKRELRSGGIQETDIEVRTDGNSVTLEGKVSSETEKQRAETIARQVEGVQTVENRLQVSGEYAGQTPQTDTQTATTDDDTDRVTPGERATDPVTPGEQTPGEEAAELEDEAGETDDDAIAKSVAEKLASEVFTGAQAKESWFFGWEVEGAEYGFDVDVDDGTVRLDGRVRSIDDIQKAVEAIQGMAGVNSIRSELAFEAGTGAHQQDPLSHAGRATQGAAEQAGEATRSGLEEAGEAVESAAEATREGVQEGAEATAEGAERAGEAAANLGDEVTDLDENKIRQVQRKLEDEGHYEGEIDGVMGEETRTAIREYQREEGLQATGTLNTETMQRLGVQ